MRWLARPSVILNKRSAGSRYGRRAAGRIDIDNFEILVDRARFDLLPGQIDRRLVDCEGTELGIEQRIEGEDAQASGSWNPDPSLLGLRDAALFQGAWRTGLGMVRRGAGARLRAQPFLHRVAQRRR